MSIEILVLIFLHSTKSIESIDSPLRLRRVLNGQPFTAFRFPFSSVVSLRVETLNWQPYCSGTIIGPHAVLTAAHCIMDNSGSKFRIGYGDLGITSQKIIDVGHIYTFNNLNICLLELKEPISQTKKITFFLQDYWHLDLLKEIVENKTMMCGYGLDEETYLEPRDVRTTDAIRCVNYRYSGNFKTVRAKSKEPYSLWPHPPTGVLEYDHDDRYMVSISRDPEEEFDIDEDDEANAFATGCRGDAGAPVFYKANDTYFLQGIHHGSPYNCGNASIEFEYDSAVLMKPILDEIEKNDIKAFRG